MNNNSDNKLVAVLYAQHCNPSIKSKNQTVNKYFSIIFESVINNFNGKIQKETTVTFSAITYAVKCAIELQKTIRKWNLFQTIDDNIELGIIIDVCELDTNNILSSIVYKKMKKLFFLSNVGNIISTQVVYNSIRSESDIFTRDTGRINIPGYNKPERYYKVYLDEINWKLESKFELNESLLKHNIRLEDRISMKKKQVKIFISPIESNSKKTVNLKEKIQKYIYEKLDKIKNIQIIDNTDSIDQYFLLNGTIIKYNQGLRITVNLENIINNEIFTKTYECKTNGLNPILETIIGNLLIYLHIPISNKQKRLFTQKLSSDSTALRFFMQGSELINSHSDKKTLKVAVSILKNSLDRDNSFIDAKCELAFAYLKLENLDLALETILEAEYSAKENSNQYGLATTNRYKGIFLKYIGNYKRVINYYEKSKTLLKEINENSDQVDVLESELKVLQTKYVNDNDNTVKNILAITPENINNEKKILVIMFTELVDFGKYDNQKELLKLHDKEMERIINNCNGKIIKHISEKILAVFKTPEYAVYCSNQIHKFWKDYNQKNIRLRVGIHMGEVSIKDDDVFGDCINMAARIEPIALPGTTAVSQIFYFAIQYMPLMSFTECKAVVLKNIQDPERIYFIYKDKPQILRCSKDRLFSKLLEQGITFFSGDSLHSFEVSLIVLYLKNIGKKEDEYISYGFTEDLIQKFQKTNLIFVPTMAETMKYKEFNKTAIQIGREKKIKNILLGSINKKDKDITLQLDLVNSVTGKNIWTFNKTEKFSNKENILNDLVVKILEELTIPIPDYIKKQKVKQLTINPEAYENYLKGNFIFETGKSSKELETGKKHLEQSMKQDPDFVEARYIHSMIDQKLGNNDEALKTLGKASRIAKKNNNDAGIASVENGFGLIYLMTGRFSDAIPAFEKALKIRIKLTDLHDQARISNNLGQCYSNTGQPNKAERQHLRALKINKEVGDENGVSITYLNLVAMYNMNSQFDRGIKTGYDSLGSLSQGENLFAKERLLYNLGQSLIMVGRYSEGEKVLQESKTIAKEFNDDAVIGMVELYLGIYRSDEGKYGLANTHFDKAQEYFDRSNHISGKVMLPLEIGLNDFLRGKYSTAIKNMEKTAKLAANLNELDYVNMARSASILVKSFLGKCILEDVDKEADKLSKINHLITMRTAWYLCQAYLIHNDIKKADKFQKKSRKILLNIAKVFVYEDIRTDFMVKINLHNNINSDLAMIPLEYSIYQFCYYCGISNTTNSENCIKCNTSLRKDNIING